MTEKPPPSRHAINHRHLFALLAGLCAWWVVCWLAADAYFGQRTDAALREETAKAEQYVATTAEGFERIVAVRLGMPRLLARDPEVRHTFARIGLVAPGAEQPYEERKRRWSADPALAALNQRFAQDAADLRVGAIGLFDTQGNTFALGTAPGDKNWLGVNYIDRDYFTDILAGRSGYRVIFGKKFGVPGIAFFAPVVDKERVIGAVISRVDLTPFLNWLTPADAFLTDRNGVVVLASDINIAGSALADAPVQQLGAAARQVAYHHAVLAPLDIAPAGDERYPELRRVPGREHPIIHRSRSTAHGAEPTVHVFWPFPQRAELAAQRNIVALGVAAGGTALLLLTLTALARRRGLVTQAAERTRHEEAQSTTLAELRDKTLFQETLLNALKDAGMQLMMIEHGRIAYVGNRELARRAGWSDAKIDARPALLDIIHPDDRARVANNHRRRLAGEAAPTRYEVALQGAGGERIEYEVAISLVPGNELARAITICWEIGERKRAQRDLLLLRRAIDHASEGFFLIGEEGRFVDVNAAACRSLGYRREELLGKTPFDIDPDTTPEKVADLEALPDGTAITVETRHRAKDGQIFPVEMIVAGFIEGGVRYGIALTRDITERKAMEEKLQFREQMLQDAQRIAHVGSWDVDIVNDKLDWSDEIFRIWEIDKTQFKADLAAFLETVHPDDRGHVDQAYNAAIAEHSLYEIEHRLLFADGRVKYILERGEPQYDAQGKPVRFIGTSLDITERKRAESALLASEAQSSTYASLLQAVVESSPKIIVFALDRDYRYLAFNEQHRNTMRALWGQEIAIGMCMLDVIGQHSDRKKAQQGFDRALAGEAFVSDDAYGDAALTRLYWQTYWSPIHSKDGTVSGLTCFVLNISERKRIEEALAQREREFRSLTENLPDNVARWDTEGRYLYINPTHERTLGKTCDEIVGTHLPDSHEQVKAAFAQVVATARASHAVRQAADVNGAIEVHEVILVPECDADGRVVSVLGLGRNMTDLYRMQDALARSEAEFRTLAENLPVALIRYDAEHRRRYLNPAAERMLHSTAAELLGQVPDGASVPATPAMIERYRGRMEGALTTNSTQELDVVLDALPDDQQEHYEVLFVPERGADGQPAGVLAIWYDITERERAEARLRAVLDLNVGVIHAIPDILFEVDRQGRYLNIWSKNPDMLAAQQEVLLGRTVAEVLEPESAAAAMAAIRAADANGTTYGHEIIIKQVDGETRWYEHSLAKKHGHTPADDSFIVLSRDITERKRMENALRRSEEEFRALVENSPDMVARYDRDCRRVYANPALLAGLKSSADLGLNKAPTEAFPSSASAAEYEAAIRTVLASGEEGQFTMSWRNAGGNRAWSDIRLVPERDAHDEVVGLLAIGRDVTERKRMEAQVDRERATLRAFFDALPDLAWMKDSEGRYLASNPLHERCFGASEADMLGKTDFDFVDAELATLFRQKDREAAIAGRPCSNEEWVVFAADGRRVLLETVKAPVRDVAGNIVGVIGVAHDITDRKATEAAREAALAEAERLARLRSAFMAQMSHELRTPLNGILGFTQLMQMDDGLSGEMRNWAGLIRDNGEHLLALINQVLDFAKIEAGKLTLDFDDIRLASFLDTVAATIRVGAEKKHLAFALVLAPDLPAFVRTDALRLRQILLNLLGNAVKFTKQGRVELRVSQSAPARLRFEVSDTGPGIAPEKQGSIFEPFEQIEGGSRIAEGAGLGLAISSKLAQLMGGDIAVESHLGKGSCFSVELDMTVVAGGAQTPADAYIVAPEVLEVIAEVEAYALPAAAELDQLLELARQGYLRRIVRRAAELEAAHAAFAGHLGRLAEAYRSKEVEAYLQRCLDAKVRLEEDA